MAVIYKTSKLNVVEAARKRIKNVFDSGLKVAMSTSGGKDSICMSHVAYSLIQEGQINPAQLTVQFIDEEAMYDDVIEIVKDWRKKFLMVGARFEWFCMPFLHFNCLNYLEDSESHMVWDNSKKDVWVREMPSFAITSHPQFRQGKDNYQAFLMRINKKNIQLIGVRIEESVHRRTNIANIFTMNSREGLSPGNAIYPIYDWKDEDIWLYIKENNLKFPKTYIDLYQIGTPINRLRISQFFSMDTARGLLKLSEMQPGLMEKILRREPNAYLVLLYWDSEMFRRSSKTRNELSQGKKDYKSEVLKLLNNIDKVFQTESLKENAKRVKKAILKYWFAIEKESHWRTIYDCLIAGDDKVRTLRGIINSIQRDYAEKIKKELNINDGTPKTD